MTENPKKRESAMPFQPLLGTVLFRDVWQLYHGVETKDIEEDSTFDMDQDVVWEINKGLYPWEQIKPILRPLTNIREDELVHAYKCMYWGSEPPKDRLHFAGWRAHIVNNAFDGGVSPRCLAYLLKQWFDLFGLIESGEALAKDCA